MTTLYIIIGFAEVRKSTISKKIAISKERSALIEGDDIYHQVIGGYVPAWKQGNHLDIFSLFIIQLKYFTNIFLNHLLQNFQLFAHCL